MRRFPTAIRTFLSSVPWQWIFDQEAVVEGLSPDSAGGVLSVDTRNVLGEFRDEKIYSL